VTALITTKEEFKSQFELDDLKRILFVFPKDTWKDLEKKVSSELLEIEK